MCVYVDTFWGHVAPFSVPRSAKQRFFETTIRGPQKGPGGSLVRFENASSGALACGNVFSARTVRKVAIAVVRKEPIYNVRFGVPNLGPEDELE